jgi:radical SAM protein with 4Fe4S-binding SPASM domain
MLKRILKIAGKVSETIKPIDALLNRNKFKQRLAERLINMRKDYPFEYVLEITTRCNHLCKMCTFKHKEKTNRGDMSFQIYKKIIDEIPVDRGSVIEYAGGGEPLLHKEFLAFLEYGKKKHPQSRFFLSTNGSFLDEEMGQNLIDLELDLLNVGLNSTTREGHRWLTNSSDFDSIVKNTVDFMKKKNRNGFRKPYTFVQIIECKELAHEIEEFKRFWTPIADQLHIRHVIAGMDEGVLKSENISQIYPVPGRRYPCALPFRCVSIGANGDLFPCNIFSHEGIPWGNLHQNSIHEMWSSKSFLELRRIQLEDCFASEPLCKNCDMWAYSDNFWIRNFTGVGKRKWL